MVSELEFFHKSREFQPSDYIRFKAKDFPNGEKAHIWEMEQDGEGQYEVWKSYVVLYLSDNGNITLEAGIGNSIWLHDFFYARKDLPFNESNFEDMLATFNRIVLHMSSYPTIDKKLLRRWLCPLI